MFLSNPSRSPPFRQATTPHSRALRFIEGREGSEEVKARSFIEVRREVTVERSGDSDDAQAVSCLRMDWGSAAAIAKRMRYGGTEEGEDGWMQGLVRREGGEGEKRLGGIRLFNPQNDKKRLVGNF